VVLTAGANGPPPLSYPGELGERAVRLVTITAANIDGHGADHAV